MSAKKVYRVEVDLAATLEIEATCEDEARDLARIGWRHSFAGFPVECDFERVEASEMRSGTED